MRYWITGVNPEPWAIGSAYRRGPKGVGIAPNTKTKAYETAVAEEFVRQNPDFTKMGGPLTLHMVFWRNTEHGNVCDVTNVQKSTEDALQGILYDNDKGNIEVASTMAEQTTDTVPAILIDIEPFSDRFVRSLNVPVHQEPGMFSDSTWEQPSEELF